jgi:hypothetical protein
METLLTTVLSSALILSTTFSSPTPTTAPVVFTRVLPEKDYVGYVVEKEDTLAVIAEKAYGSDAYWTTVWNDNPGITDPEAVAEDTVLKIRAEKPAEPLELNSVLASRNDDIVKQKNDAYLKQIGYLSTEKAAPTVIPTQPVPSSTSNVAGTISEEAITYLGNCEAGMNPAKNTGNGYYGAFQFSYGTWQKLNTGYERADLAPIEVQKAAVKQLLQKSSIHGQFPGCASKMRSAGLI